MPNQKFVINILGRPASGKSTLEKAISAKLPGIFTVDYDHLKWQLSGYNRNRDKALIHKIATEFYQVVCHQEISIILNLFAHDEQEYMSYKKIAEDQGYKFLAVFLVAPDEVLLERFHKRIDDAKITGIKISVTDENIFKGFLTDTIYTPPGILTFDTSKTDMNIIAEDVITAIN